MEVPDYFFCVSPLMKTALLRRDPPLSAGAAAAGAGTFPGAFLPPGKLLSGTLIGSSIDVSSSCGLKPRR